MGIYQSVLKYRIGEEGERGRERETETEGGGEEGGKKKRERKKGLK